MTGLEKIIDQILLDAKAKADEELEGAKLQAEEILAQADAEAKKLAEDINRRSELEVENYKKSAASANDLYRRTEVLKNKQEVISRIIQKAYERVCGLDADSYFAMLEKMVAKNVSAQAGVLYLSEKDMGKIPEGFEQRVSQIAENAGGTLSVSKEGKPIENGFVLVYGGIEDNCTIKALFDAKRDQMQDMVHNLLYRKGV